MTKHQPAFLAVVILTLLFYIVTVLLSYAPNFPPLREVLGGLFTSETGAVSDELYLDITPANWTFLIWAVIYIWQALWIIYAHTLLCRKTNDWQGYLYYRPPFIPIAFYIVFWINLVLNVAWLVTFDRKMLEASSPILFASSISLYICLGLSYRGLHKAGPALIRLGHGREIGLVRCFIHNGIGVYAGWTSVASLLNFAQAITYKAGLDQKDAGTIALGFLALEVIGFLIFDNFIIDKYSRYTFTPYFVIIYALVGSIQKNWEFGARNSVITAVDLGLACFALLFKIVNVIKRSRFEPEPILRNVEL